MKKLLFILPVLALTACAGSPSVKALKEVNKSKVEVTALTALQAKTSTKLVKAKKDLETNKAKFEEIYGKEFEE